MPESAGLREFPISAADYGTVARMMCPGQRFSPPGRRTITTTSARFEEFVAIHGEPLQRLCQAETRTPLAMIWPELEAWNLGHARAIYRPRGAKIWLCWDGDRPTPAGSPHAEVSLTECIAKLGLAKTHYSCDLANKPIFGRADDPLAAFRGPRHVVVEVTEQEAARHQWTPGFYRAPVTPDEIRALYGDITPPQ